MSASYPGYLSGTYRRSPGQLTVERIALADGQWLQGVNVELWKPAAVGGTVLDESGGAVVGVAVRGLLAVTVAGRRQFVTGPVGETDDRGIYRLTGFAPGDYVIQVPIVQVTLPEGTTYRTARGAGVSADSTILGGRVAAIVAGDTVPVAGHYAIGPANPDGTAYAMTFHPAALSLAAASAVRIGYGDELEGIDLRLALVSAVTVSGRVVGAEEAVGSLPIRLLPTGGGAFPIGAEVAYTETDAQGKFTFLKVPAGQYTLVASRNFAEYRMGHMAVPEVGLPRGAASISSMSRGEVPGVEGLTFAVRSAAGAAVSGRQEVSVGDRDVVGLIVPLTGGVKVSGTFLWDDSEITPGTVQQVPAIRLEPANGDLSLGVRIRTPGSPREALPSPLPFEVHGVLPGQYVIGQLQSANFSIEAVEWRGRNLVTRILDIDGSSDISGIVVRLTSKLTALTGRVTSINGGTAANGAVLAFPADPSQWTNSGLSAVMFRATSISPAGTYHMDRLIPGEYLVVAVTDADRQKWLDPDFLSTIARHAFLVRVDVGATVSRDLQIVSGIR